MKFSGRLVIPLALAFFLYLLACGCNSKQPDSDTPVIQKPPVVSPDKAPDKTNDNNNAVVSGTYANDLGPGSVDDNGIPPGLKNGYKLLRVRCIKCHTVARPLNAQYIEADEMFRAKLLASNPEALKDPNLLKLESEIWRRMVKRMIAKPGNTILSNEGKEIHAFLVWYYLDKVGPSGAASESWINHRRGLLAEFKKKYPERYKELYGN